VPRPVLVVDDDPDFLGLSARLLAEMGVQAVATASNAARALEVARDLRPWAALVDVGLPDRNGIDLARELASLPWIPRVILTSSDHDAWLAIETRRDGGKLPFIPKEELGIDTLRQVLVD
jgi:CheY-like chemotaxis protein